VHTERYPLRLGESVFVRPRFSEEIFKKAAKAFRHFRELMDEFGVTRYRAWPRALRVKRGTASCLCAASNRNRE